MNVYSIRMLMYLCVCTCVCASMCVHMCVSVCCVICGWYLCVSWGRVISRFTVALISDICCTLETLCGGEDVRE